MQTPPTVPGYPSVAHVECPYPVLAELRAAGSVHHVPDTNRYLVTHYDDVDFVLRHPGLFSSTSEERVQPFDLPGPAGVPPETLGPRGHVLNVIELDPPHHKRRRDRMFSVIKPARLHAHRQWIEEIVDALIDGFIDRGRVELVSEFAYPLPTHVVIRILGLSRDDFDWMQDWGLVEWSGGARYLSDETRARQRPGALRAEAEVNAAILERVERPREDGLTEMIRAQIEQDGGFNLAIVRADLGQFVRAGIMTTGHLISNAMVLLLEHDAVREEVTAHPGRLRAMLEEALRLEAPLQWIPRIAVSDVELGGVPIPAGSYLLVLLASANRDEARWGESACAFDPARPGVTDHLGFGKGVHFCLGAPLGRLESQIAFGRLLARLANIRIAPGARPRYLESPTLRGLEALELEFDRAA